VAAALGVLMRFGLQSYHDSLLYQGVIGRDRLPPPPPADSDPR